MQSGRLPLVPPDPQVSCSTIVRKNVFSARAQTRNKQIFAFSDEIAKSRPGIATRQLQNQRSNLRAKGKYQRASRSQPTQTGYTGTREIKKITNKGWLPRNQSNRRKSTVPGRVLERYHCNQEFLSFPNRCSVIPVNTV